jgi:TPP-dependent pyruvate/acetoin dehydrogenase alpha subunit
MTASLSLSQAASVPVDQLRDLYRTMVRIRRFEEEALVHYKLGKIAGSLHVSIGQEACSAGAGAALRDGDYIIGTHRSHGDVIARGARLDRMMAELFGRVDGYSGGKGGSMHIMDASRGILGANGIVAAGLPIAVGAGLSASLRGSGQVVLAFFGDGAVAKGNFHESLNLASIWGLPVIFFCQNNQYAVSMSIRSAHRTEAISAHAAAYGVAGAEIDGNDVLAVLATTTEAVERARRGDGPTLISALTYRWQGHNVSDPGRYRTAEEVADWKTRDPIARLRDAMVKEGISTADSFEAIDREVDREVEAAVSFADASLHPAPESALRDVYA